MGPSQGLAIKHKSERLVGKSPGEEQYSTGGGPKKVSQIILG